MLTLRLQDEKEMQSIGEMIGHYLQPGDLIILTGELGTGKTTLSKGIAKGLGIQQTIKSPTYTLVREYDEGQYPLYHMDVYRLDGQVDGIGLEDYLDGSGVTLIEWGELIEEELPNPIHIFLTYQDEGRELKIDFGNHSELQEKLQQSLAK